MATAKSIRIVGWRKRTGRLAGWLKRRRERKQVLGKLRQIVPFVNENTPLLELLQRIIDYITELQVISFCFQQIFTFYYLLHCLIAMNWGSQKL